MKNIFHLCMMALASVTLLTCTETPEELIPNPNPGSVTELTDEERLAVLKECAQMMDLIGDLKSEAAQQILVQWLRTRPEFEEADTAAGNVWAYFYDGRVVMFVPNWLGSDDAGGRRPATDITGRRESHYSSGRTSDLPHSNKVTLFNGLGKAFVDDRDYLKGLFTKSHTRYEVDKQDASIENLENISDLGVFYISAHGGVGEKKPRGSNQGFFGLWTTDTASVANEKKYEAELNSNMLVYMLAVDDSPRVSELHYAITKYFVSHSSTMKFAGDAIMYIDACNGMHANASSFWEAMIKKTANQQATYIGWTAPMSSAVGTPAGRFIFDRLLGSHDESVLMEQEPLQRPFDWPSIFDDIQHLVSPVLGVSQHGGRLAYVSRNTSEAILTPTIEYISMDDYDSRMVIKGVFGENTQHDGKVTVAGKQAHIVSWTPNLIMCDIPTTGNGSSGNVIVSVRDNDSNVVQLTEWTIPVNISRDEFGITTEVNLNLKIRADVHPYRSKPGEPPKTDRPDSLNLFGDPDTYGWPFSTASTGTYNVGGARISSCEVEACSIRDTESASSRNGILPYKPDGTGLRYGAFYKWSIDMKTLYVRLYAVIPDVGFKMEYYTACPNNDPINSGQSYSAELVLEIPSAEIKELELKLDDNYYFKFGKVTKSQNFKWGRCLNPVTLVSTAMWPDVGPQFAPKRETEARAGD